MPPRTASEKYRIWAGGLFVATVFILLWGTAVLRLMAHANGEAFLQKNGVLDSIIALLAPPAVFLRLRQMILLLRKERSA